MSVFDTCSCRGRCIVGHCHWFEQDCDTNRSCPEDNEWRPHNSAHYKRESSGNDADQDESLWLVNNDDEDRGFDGGWVGGWNGKRNDRRDGRRGGRRGGRLYDGRDSGLDGRLNGRWNGRRDGGLVGGRVGGWDGTPRSSYRCMPSKLIFYWDKCCQRYNNAPNSADSRYSIAHAVHHDHHGYTINGSSDSVGVEGGLIDRVEMEHHRRAAPSSRRKRPRVVRGTELF